MYGRSSWNSVAIMRTAAIVALAAVVICGVALGAPTKKPALCALGQKSSAANKCTANPAFERSACHTLVSLLQPLAPADTIVGSNTNILAPVGIDCRFTANGQPQSFNVQVLGGAIATSMYTSDLNQYTGYAKDPTITCGDGTPQAALQSASLGDKGFAWASCPPPQTGYILAAGLKGSTFAYVYANPYRVGPSLAQVESVVRMLLTRYR